MKFKKKKLFTIITIILIVVLLVGVLGYVVLYSRNKEISKNNLTDGWVYKPNSEKPSKVGILSGVFSSTATAGSKYSVAEDSATSSSNSYLGYEVGGASNIENFRKNIKNGYLPISTDITYNGIYSEYYFDTGSRNVNQNDMFYPSYSCAVSTNPFSKEQEYYMSIGLNSNIKESDFNRKNVNLVIVLDISGSMSSSFNSYYYDQSRSDNIDKNKSKIATFKDNNTKVSLDVYTSYPTIVVYACNYPSDALFLPNNDHISKHYSLCLECQYIPNGINMENEDSAILKKNTHFNEYIKFRFKDGKLVK